MLINAWMAYEKFIVPSLLNKDIPILRNSTRWSGPLVLEKLSHAGLCQITERYPDGRPSQAMFKKEPDLETIEKICLSPERITKIRAGTRPLIEAILVHSAVIGSLILVSFLISK